MLGRFIYHQIDKFCVTKAGPQLRKWGQGIFNTGLDYCGDNHHRDPLRKSLRCIPLNNKVFPKLLTADWVAPNATVIGDVETGEGSSIWHTVTIRGDTAKITIGKNTLIQDRTVLKSSTKGDSQITIGDNV